MSIQSGGRRPGDGAPGFGALLSAQPDITVIGEAADGGSRSEVAPAAPDVVLMDVRMPEMNGLEATAAIMASPAHLRPRVLMLTTFDVDDYVYEALRVGPRVLLEGRPAEELAQAVRVVARGDALLAPTITERTIADVVRRRGPVPRESPRLGELTVANARSSRSSRRTLQRRDRRAALRLRADGQDACQPGADQARPAGPRAGGRVRLRERRGDTGQADEPVLSRARRAGARPPCRRRRRGCP